MKKTYIKPTIKTKFLDSIENILAASSIGFGDDATTTTVVKSKNGNIIWNDDFQSEGGINWDDDEE